MFRVGDVVVYPMHGAGVIQGVEEKDILGEKHRYYVLQLSLGNVQALIPVGKTESIGVRPIVSGKEADLVIQSLYEPMEEDELKWNLRYRENTEKLRHGLLPEVAAVTKSLILRDRKKSLSNSERKMLNYAKNALISEIMLSKNLSHGQVEDILNEAIS